jgi:AGZA family xanthine/uracil permease-like MFS transporter
MRLFVRRDLDGFFGLFVDNLVQLLLIVALFRDLCGMTEVDARFLLARVLPGAAVSILFGNVFYAYQAHKLARREGRTDVTALPYGINTPSLLVFVYFVIVPVYQSTGSVEAAWQMGLLACLGSGFIELTGSLVAEKVRRHTPRAALLATLAGIAIGFISMTFMLQIWSRPVVALVPTAIVLITYFSGTRFPWRIPGGLLAIIAGTLLAWLLPGEWSGHAMSSAEVEAAWSGAGWTLPMWSGGAVLAVLKQPGEWIRYLSVIVPMGLFNVIGSLQNIESAEAGGDRFDTRSSLAANGAGTILAALFGSCFPTTIYIGHPGWKGLGARAGYSTLNGLVIVCICLSGAVALVDRVVPIEAGMAIVLWIGIVITAQAYQATPREHAPAVAIGLFPAAAAWGATVMFGAFMAAGGVTMQSLLEVDPQAAVSGFVIHGLIVLERGSIFTCMVVAALSVCLIERRFFAAAIWALAGGVFTLTGLTHAYQLVDNSVDYLLLFTTATEGAYAYRGYGLVWGYWLMALVFVGVGLYARGAGAAAHEAHDA